MEPNLEISVHYWYVSDMYPLQYSCVGDITRMSLSIWLSVHLLSDNTDFHAQTSAKFIYSGPNLRWIPVWAY